MKQLTVIIALFAAVSLSAQQSDLATNDAVAQVSSERSPVASDVSVYPNPASKFLYLEVDHAHFNPTGYRFFDLIGNVVLEGRIETAERIKIDLSTLNNEAFFMRIYDDAGNSITKRVIKR